ncbi:hypothetical protein [Streptomyces sp. NPDC127092]
MAVTAGVILHAASRAGKRPRRRRQAVEDRQTVLTAAQRLGHVLTG